MIAEEPAGVGILEPELTQAQWRRLRVVEREAAVLGDALIRASRAKVISWQLANTVCKELERSIYAAEHPLDLWARVGWRAP